MKGYPIVFKQGTIPEGSKEISCLCIVSLYSPFSEISFLLSPKNRIRWISPIGKRPSSLFISL